MRLKSATFKNLKPIYRSSGKKEIYIDFSKCLHKITLIIGPNGSGKSTIINALQPLPDASTLYIDGEEGEKILEYYCDDIIYVLRIVYPVNGYKKRTQTKAFIKKIMSDGTEFELNPNGNIGSYKDVLYSEFKLDANFVSLSKLSMEDRGIVERSPGDRKRYFGSMLEEVQVYNDINKAITKRSSVYRSMINSITAKIDNIGDRELLDHDLLSVENNMKRLQESIEYFTKIISDNESMIRVLDPDGSIQQNYAMLCTEKRRLESSINDVKIPLSRFTSKYPDINSATLKIEDINKAIQELDITISLNKDRLSDYLASKEEDYSVIKAKQQKLDSLKSNFVVEDLRARINELRQNVQRYLEVFDKIGIVDFNITKDEYIIGLNTLKQLQDMVITMRSFTTQESILKSIEAIRTNASVSEMKNEIDNRLDGLNKQRETLNNQLSFYRGLLSTTDILSKRPVSCVDDTCPFIKNAVESLKQQPKENIERIEIELDQLEKQIRGTISEKNDIDIMVETYQYIDRILRSIQNNSNILSKLPNGDIFGNIDKFLESLINGSNFSEINSLYQYMQYSNVFELYKNEKEELTKLEYEYKLHENKIEIIEEIGKELETLYSKVKDIDIKIQSYHETLTSLSQERMSLGKELQNVTSVKDLYEKLKELEERLEMVNSQITQSMINMNQIQNNIKTINTANENLMANKSDIKPLQDQRDSIKFKLQQLEEYEKELNVFNQKYNIIEMIKKYSSPTKNGIQMIFMKLYMGKTLELTNSLISYFFEGELQLLPYVINENEFRIPCKNINSSVINDDISSCSSAEKSMISMILSFALLRQCSTKYNILMMDEMDATLDQRNRANFIRVIDEIMETLEVDNCVLVSHSSEIDMSNVDTILLQEKENNMYGYNNGNIIFSY